MQPTSNFSRDHQQGAFNLFIPSHTLLWDGMVWEQYEILFM